MTWQIILATGIGVVAFYLFRYQAERVLNPLEYIRYEWRALFKGAAGAGMTILLWTYIPTVLGWLGINIAWPTLRWDLAVAIGCLGKLIYKYAPNIVKAILERFGKKFQ
jgi:hypothetical protein